MCKYPYFRLLWHYMPYGNGCTIFIDKTNINGSYLLCKKKKKQFKRPSNWLASFLSFTKPVYRRIQYCCCYFFFLFRWFSLNFYQQKYKRHRQQQRVSRVCVYWLIVRGMSSLWHQLSLSLRVFLAYVAKQVLFIFFFYIETTSWYEHLSIGTIVNDTHSVREKKNFVYFS